jgi:hypothetical protein
MTPGEPLLLQHHSSLLRITAATHARSFEHLNVVSRRWPMPTARFGSSRAARIPLRVLAKPTRTLTTMVLHVLTSRSSREMRSVGPSLGSFHLFDLCQASA